MGKFKAALDKEKDKERIKRDLDDAAKFGARGTPNFFINGRNFRGAQPIEAFKAVIDEEIKKADAKIAAGTPRGQLYAALTKDGLDKAAAPPPPQPPGRARRQDPLPGRGQGRAGQGRQGRAGHDRAVLGLPVPVLQPRRADHQPGDGGVQGQGPRRVARPAAAVPPQRDAGRRSRRAPRASRASSGRCTTRSSPTSSTLDRATSRSTPGAGPQHGQVQGRARRAEGQGSDRGRRGRGRQDRRARHAGVLHQRQVPVGRAAVRGVQGEDRRGAEERRGAGRQGDAQGQGLRGAA